MPPEIQPGRALYYPNFSPDPNWLKCSLLYWDQIYRIVPDAVKEDVFKKDPADCATARKEGLLEVKDPKDYREGAGEQFRTKLEPIVRSEEPHHRRWLKRVKAQLTTPIHRGKTPRWLHDAKVPTQLKYDLQREGLVKHDGDRLAMPHMVAGLYMSCLATEMGNRIRTHVMTDQSVLSEGTESMLFSGTPTQAERDVADERSLLLRLGIRFPKPEAMEAVSMKKLVTFHQKNDRGRQQFREVFDALLANVKTADDPNHLEGILNDARKDLTKAMDQHRSDLKGLGVTGLWSFLKISVPSMFAAKWLENFAYMPALGVAGLALGAAAALVDIRRQRAKQLAESPWHYAWKVQRTFR
jgi:hypothetical protein